MVMMMVIRRHKFVVPGLGRQYLKKKRKKKKEKEIKKASESE